MASTSKVFSMGHINQPTWVPAPNIPSPLKWLPLFRFCHQYNRNRRQISTRIKLIVVFDIQKWLDRCGHWDVLTPASIDARWVELSWVEYPTCHSCFTGDWIDDLLQRILCYFSVARTLLDDQRTNHTHRDTTRSLKIYVRWCVHIIYASRLYF